MAGRPSGPGWWMRCSCSWCPPLSAAGSGRCPTVPARAWNCGTRAGSRARQRSLRQEVQRLPLCRQRLQENRPRPQRHRQARHLHRQQQQSHRRIPENLDRKRRHHDAPVQRSPRTSPDQRRRRLRKISVATSPLFTSHMQAYVILRPPPGGRRISTSTRLPAHPLIAAPLAATLPPELSATATPSPQLSATATLSPKSVIPEGDLLFLAPCLCLSPRTVARRPGFVGASLPSFSSAACTLTRTQCRPSSAEFPSRSNTSLTSPTI